MDPTNILQNYLNLSFDEQLSDATLKNFEDSLTQASVKEFVDAYNTAANQDNWNLDLKQVFQRKIKTIWNDVKFVLYVLKNDISQPTMKFSTTDNFSITDSKGTMINDISSDDIDVIDSESLSLSDKGTQWVKAFKLLLLNTELTDIQFVIENQSRKIVQILMGDDIVDIADNSEYTSTVKPNIMLMNYLNLYHSIYMSLSIESTINVIYDLDDIEEQVEYPITT